MIAHFDDSQVELALFAAVMADSGVRVVSYQDSRHLLWVFENENLEDIDGVIVDYYVPAEMEESRDQIVKFCLEKSIPVAYYTAMPEGVSVIEGIPVFQKTSINCGHPVCKELIEWVAVGSQIE